MTQARPAKKSEAIEVRLSFAAKAAFMERCRQEQRTASEAIRLFIDGQIDTRPAPQRTAMPHWRMIVATIAGVAFGLGATAPSFAHPRQTTRAAFDQLDRDHDGTLTYAEFRGK